MKKIKKFKPGKVQKNIGPYSWRRMLHECPISRTLKEAGYSRSQCAKALGVGPVTFCNSMEDPKLLSIRQLEIIAFMTDGSFEELVHLCRNYGVKADDMSREELKVAIAKAKWFSD